MPLILAPLLRKKKPKHVLCEGCFNISISGFITGVTWILFDTHLPEISKQEPQATSSFSTAFHGWFSLNIQWKSFTLEISPIPKPMGNPHFLNFLCFCLLIFQLSLGFISLHFSFDFGVQMMAEKKNITTSKTIKASVGLELPSKHSPMKNSRLANLKEL